MEAQDIHVHLLPLQHHLETLESIEFPKVKPRLPPLLHVVCLIWATCKGYRSPGRLTVLLQEICNLLIKQVSTSSPLPAPGISRNIASPGVGEMGWRAAIGTESQKKKNCAFIFFPAGDS